LKTLKADDEVRRLPVVGAADAMTWIETLHAIAFVLLNPFLQSGDESIAGIRVFDRCFSYDMPSMEVLRGFLRGGTMPDGQQLELTGLLKDFPGLVGDLVILGGDLR
jgi:hypothetical protein